MACGCRICLKLGLFFADGGLQCPKCKGLRLARDPSFPVQLFSGFPIRLFSGVFDGAKIASPASFRRVPIAEGPTGYA